MATSPPLSKGRPKSCPLKHAGHCCTRIGAQELHESGRPYLVGEDEGDKEVEDCWGAFADRVTFWHSCSILSAVFSISICKTLYH